MGLKETLNDDKVPVKRSANQRRCTLALFMDIHKHVDGLTAEAVHRVAHGLVADEIIEVTGGR